MSAGWKESAHMPLCSTSDGDRGAISPHSHIDSLETLLLHLSVGKSTCSIPVSSYMNVNFCSLFEKMSAKMARQNIWSVKKNKIKKFESHHPSWDLDRSA